MEKVLADTHALVWNAEDSPKLGPRAREMMDLCHEGKGIVFFSVMSLFEIDYLVERGRVSSKLPGILLTEALKSPDSALRILDIDQAVYRSFLEIPSKSIPELPDRIIAATAMAHSLPIVTKDSIISRFDKLKTIW